MFYYSRPDGLVKAIQANNFKIMWQKQLVQSGAPFILGVTKGVLFLQSQDTIWALRTSDGTILWQQSNIGDG